ncbi:MAG: nitroreductase/quinone reductase family protein [Thermodesulfobacteriota bacterium]
MSTSNDVQDALARLARERTVRLVTRGRKSGRPREVTIWFVVDDGSIGLGTLDASRNWVRNARAAGEVELVFGDERLRGRFRDVSADPAAHERIRRGMARKYWPAWIASWLGIGQRSTFRVESLERVDATRS